MIDSDYKDVPSLYSIDLGEASAFIKGKYPNYEINPTSETSSAGS